MLSDRASMKNYTGVKKQDPQTRRSGLMILEAGRGPLDKPQAEKKEHLWEPNVKGTTLQRSSAAPCLKHIAACLSLNNG